jgi:hypothetical protein
MVSRLFIDTVTGAVSLDSYGRDGISSLSSGLGPNELELFFGSCGVTTGLPAGTSVRTTLKANGNYNQDPPLAECAAFTWTGNTCDPYIGTFNTDTTEIRTALGLVDAGPSGTPALLAAMFEIEWQLPDQDEWTRSAALPFVLIPPVYLGTETASSAAQLRAIIFDPVVTSLTGGAAGDLDAVASASMLLGTVRLVLINGQLQFWQLQAGTTAVNGTTIIHPTDYNAGTNARILQLLSVGTTSANITDASANGRSILTAANYMAMLALLSLNNVTNTSDANKPVSTAQAAALALKAPLASPALTGIPTVPTAAFGTNTSQAASTAFVQAALGGVGVTWPLVSTDGALSFGDESGTAAWIDTYGNASFAGAILAWGAANSIDPTYRLLYDQYNERAINYSSDSQNDYNSILKVDPDYGWVTVQNSNLYGDSGGSHVWSIGANGAVSFDNAAITSDGAGHLSVNAVYGDTVSASVVQGSVNILDDGSGNTYFSSLRIGSHLQIAPSSTGGSVQTSPDGVTWTTQVSWP